LRADVRFSRWVIGKALCGPPPGNAERLLGIFGAYRTNAEQALGAPR
jgi:hypothetical protein